MFDLEKQKEHFKNHIASFKDYGDIKILDFKNPESVNYRIRFLFEEDYCRLHISGDLGELTACNFNNMTYEGFVDFVNNTGYFEEKICCHNRAIYYYDYDKAKDDLEERLDIDLFENHIDVQIGISTPEECKEEFIEDVLNYLNDDTGIDARGYDKICELDPDCFEWIECIGREESGILELYMLAFKLAQEQLEGKGQDIV